jgi:hypothetical protein
MILFGSLLDQFVSSFARANVLSIFELIEHFIDHFYAQTVPTELTLARISDSCRAQKDADLVSFVHWSRHLVASIWKITRSELLIGAIAVTCNPHFPYFLSHTH